MKAVVFNGHSRPIKDIQFNEEDDLLFTGCIDRYVTLWNTETTERIGTYYHDAAVSCIVPSKDSKYLVSADTFGGIYIWEVCSGKLLCKIDESNSGGTFTSLSFGVSDRQICANMIFRSKEKNTFNNLFIFDIEEVLKTKSTSTVNSEGKDSISFTENKIPHKLLSRETKNKINITRFINANKNLLCACESGLVQLLDIEKNTVINEKQLHDSGFKIMDLHLTNQEELALSSGRDSKSILFDPETLDIINIFSVDKPKRNINSGKISPLFNPLLSESEQLRHCFIGGGQEAGKVTFTGTKEGGFEILIFDMITGEEVGSVGGHFSPINSIAVSNSGGFVVSGGEEGTIRFHILNDDYYNLRDFDF